jgi:hypothetical protein
MRHCDANGLDMGLEQVFPVPPGDRLRACTWRAHHLLALEQCDAAIAPTHCTTPSPPNTRWLLLSAEHHSYRKRCSFIQAVRN